MTPPAAEPTPLRIGIAGIWGRMGQTLLREVLRSRERLVFAAGSEVPRHPRFGDPILDPDTREPLGSSALGDAEMLFDVSDVVLDFTVPEAAPGHGAAAAESRTALVVGTTGLVEDQIKALKKAAKKTPVLLAPNMSLGVNLLLEATRMMAGRLGEEFDIEIHDLHHRDKRDAPSGTALALARAAAEGSGQVERYFSTEPAIDRSGRRPHGEIGFSISRAGDVAGEHTVTFAGPSERIELVHRATDRRIFARGALEAAQWLHRQGPGFYSMRDVLGVGRG